MVSQGTDFVGGEAMLGVFGSAMQLFKRDPDVAGQIVFPQSVSSQDLESQLFSRGRQVQKSGVGLNEAGSF
jgi:hypothetical protein